MAKKTEEKYTGPRVKDTDTFVKKARWVHGDRYDYSKVEYVNAKTKVEIICEDHGSFITTPDNHLSSLKGGGCNQCMYTGINAYTQKEFVQKARLVHGLKYNYHCVVYTKSTDKVKIECPTHGFFYQNSTAHLRGAGCGRCAKGNKLKTEFDEEKTKEFIEKAREVHGYKYGYENSRVISTQNRHKIEIHCPFHGKFYQTYHKHLSRGCQKCSGRNLDTEDIIKVFEKSHGNLYDYSNVEYRGCDSAVSIVCKKHGPFEQLPVVHRKGHGCPRCATEKTSKRMVGSPNFSKAFYSTNNNVSNLYVCIVNDEFLKVGLAVNPEKRKYLLKKQSELPVFITKMIQGKANDLWNLEQKILRKSNLERFYPEVSFGGQSECLHLSELPKVLAIIEDWEENQQSEQKSEEDA